MKTKKFSLPSFHLLSFAAGLLAIASAAVSFFGWYQVFGLGLASLALSSELGKFALNQHMSRNKSTISALDKMKMRSLMGILLLVSSTGIYMHLTYVYKQSRSGSLQASIDVEAQKNAQSQIKKRIAELESQVSSIPSNYPTGRSKIIAAIAPEVHSLQEQLVEAQIAETKATQDRQITDNNNPLKNLADLFRLDADQLANLLIIALVLTFDPLAVVLVAASSSLKTMSPKTKKKIVKVVAQKTMTAKTKKSLITQLDFFECQVPSPFKKFRYNLN